MKTNADIARKSINRLNQTCYSQEQGILTGRNRSFTLGNVEYHFHKALTAVVAIEDAEGVEAAGKLSDRLTAARQRAVEARLLTNGQVAEIEREVTTEVPA